MKPLNLALAFVPKTQAAKPLPAKPVASKIAGSKPLNVAFVVYQGMETLDLIGPMDVFSVANGTRPNSYNLYTVGAQTGPMAIENSALSIQPRYTLDNCPQPDILVIPGGPGGSSRSPSANAPFVRWIEHKAAGSRVVLSVCTGAFLVGKAGLLDGHKSTTHWNYLRSLQDDFPRTTVMQGVRVVQDGKLVTTAGVSNGIDGALHTHSFV